MWQYDNPDGLLVPNGLVATPVWSPRLINNGAFVTVPGEGVVGGVEVQMTSGHMRWQWTDGSKPELLHTQYASGGCTPFAFVIHGLGGDRGNTAGLAHLCAAREEEAFEMGAFARKKTTHAHSVYLVIVHNRATQCSIEMTVFGDFQRGFGQAIPEGNKGVVVGTTGTAAVHPAGFVGEMPPARCNPDTPVNIVSGDKPSPRRWKRAWHR